MMTDRLRTRLLATTMICGVAFAAPAFAQGIAPGGTGQGAADAAKTATNAAGAAADATDLIVVTGSRIAQPQLTSATPLTVVGAAEIKQTGTTRIEDLLNNLPQVFAGQGANISNGSTGIATVDLRGLGAARTLVLINGKRAVPGDVTTPFADLNFIPATIVQRVDVLTGGASSTYGADAVAGVVNFIMDTTFEGVRVDGQYSFFQHNNSGDSRVRDALNASRIAVPSGNAVDGQTYEGSIAIGVKSPDGRGHVSLYGTYQSTSPVTQDQRYYSACQLREPARPANTQNRFLCQGSGTTAPGQFFTDAGDDLTIDRTTGQFRDFNAGTDTFNFAPYNFYQRDDERFTLGGFAEYEVSQAFKPYLEAMFLDDHTNAVIAPSGLFGQSVTVACNSPLLNAGQIATLCPADPETGIVPGAANLTVLRRNIEGGGRDADFTHDSFRIVVGSRGDIGAGFSYDASYYYGKTQQSQVYRNDFSVTRTQRATNIVEVDGQLTCQSVVDGTDPNCVPYNIFTPTRTIQTDPRLGVTQAALNYLQTPGLQRGSTVEQVANISFTNSDLGNVGFRSPFAERGIGISVGGEYRSENLQTDTDIEFSTGDLAGQGGPTVPIQGSFHVAEGFAEIVVPIVEKKPFFELLQFESGYRYSDYSLSGHTDTFKFNGLWAPSRDIKFRGGYNRAVRAPNILELFVAQQIALFGGNDPCAGQVGADGTINGVTAAQCANTGVTAAQFGRIPGNTAGQLNQLIGGNLNLRPEQADTFTGGVVLTPRFIPRLSVTVDFFDIKLRDQISTVSPALALQNCLTSGNPTLCALIQRSARGDLFLPGTTTANTGKVVATNTNIGGLKTRGIDVAANYKFNFDDVGLGRIPGGLSFDFFGTYLDQLRTNPGIPIGPTGAQVQHYDCAGLYGNTCGTPNPRWRSQLRATYTSPAGFSASVRWRYYDSVRVENTSVPLAGTVYAASTYLGHRDYFDLAFNVRVTDRHEFRFGVNNALDKDPPLSGSRVSGGGSYNGNTYAQVYDTLGRYFFAGFNAKF